MTKTEYNAVSTTRRQQVVTSRRIVALIGAGSADAVKLETLLSQADKALYAAKTHGKNCTYEYKGEEEYALLVSSD
jgi:GGDEF domain-containing protein